MISQIQEKIKFKI